MPDSELMSGWRRLLDGIDSLIVFADEQEEWLLAAKAEDVRVLILKHLLSPTPPEIS
jgi:hypothetical protein